MDKKDKNFVVEGTVKVLISFIPGVGGAIGSILSDILADRKEERLNEFLQSLKDEITTNKEKINNDFISKVDFLDIFESTTLKIVNERSDVKRIGFKNILLNGILSHHSYDELDNQIRILEQLNADHILLLSFFNSPETFISEASQIRTVTTLRFFQRLLPAWNRDYLRDHLNDLEINRLTIKISEDLDTVMRTVTTEYFKGVLTSRGSTFVKFILK